MFVNIVYQRGLLVYFIIIIVIIEMAEQGSTREKQNKTKRSPMEANSTGNEQNNTLNLKIQFNQINNKIEIGKI